MNKDELEKLYNEALELQEQGEVTQAFSMFMQGALAGDPEAQNCVAIAYDSGIGVAMDKAAALEWHRKAWRNGGHSHLANNLALCHADVGNRRQAIYYWQKAIAMGDDSAGLELAKFLLKSKRPTNPEWIIGLVYKATNSNWVSEYEQEEAAELLKELTKAAT